MAGPSGPDRGISRAPATGGGPVLTGTGGSPGDLAGTGNRGALSYSDEVLPVLAALPDNGGSLAPAGLNEAVRMCAFGEFPTARAAPVPLIALLAWTRRPPVLPRTAAQPRTPASCWRPD